MLTFGSPFILTHLSHDVADVIIDDEVRVASFFLDCRELGGWDGGPAFIVSASRSLSSAVANARRIFSF